MLVAGDVLKSLPRLKPGSAQLVIADPPYFRVQTGEDWDNQWSDETAYLDWTVTWLCQAARSLRDDGLIYVFGQLGKREHIWLHVCSAAARVLQFHDMLIWDRVVGYNERRDSFTPQYEMLLVRRKQGTQTPRFNKDAVRNPYESDVIARYLKDKRYRDPVARRRHLERGKYATNILRVPSLKGTHNEKVGHPTQKPERLIEQLILSSSEKGDLVLDLFSGSGTTAVVCQRLKRRWIAFERDPHYLRMIRKRLKQQTNEAPTA